MKKIKLKNVTLIQTACINLEETLMAADICCEGINFGAVKILTDIPYPDKRVIKIPRINNMKEYSQFMFKELNNYVDTDYALTFHHDGFIVNPSAWDNEWLRWDYIGAVWNWYADTFRVGNGAFSLRSKKLLNSLATDSSIILQNDHIIRNFAEDHNIGRIHRRVLEDKHGIKFAPENVANKFSIEAYSVRSPNNKYNNQFGFHSIWVDFNEAQIAHIPYRYPNQSRKIKYK